VRLLILLSIESSEAKPAIRDTGLDGIHCSILEVDKGNKESFAESG